jgi:hypothetical protein
MSGFYLLLICGNAENCPITTRLAVLIALSALQFLAGLWGIRSLSRELKKADHSRWNEMCDPLKYFAFSIPKELRWNRFILLRQYRKVGSKRVSLLGDLLFTLQFTAIGLVVAWVILEA